ncbi:MAG: TonB-dependent receptor [Saprospiraceae bacterium]|nr:TonB-dependent receptor [Saprospiraceae bacterium]MCF8252229.1 TonB-dependent receptor [Saprospiraceae bacterium]MCF8283273.1 TonB-dependent receptor [Bacteroidales bacterium]MCF8313891.1 TonB-dependent receptor [Saprospiraceae bacterium]MCF8443270.1 TonB-dependent receptor [Saprospiraceae bacterium]
MHKHLISCTIAMVAFLTFSNLFAQTSIISGQILLKGEQLPQPGISVFINGLEKGDVTNTDGKFKFENLAPGEYELQTSGVGFANTSQMVLVKTGEIAHVIIEIEEAVMGLPAVVVQGVSLTGGLRGLKNTPGSAHYISPQEMEKFSYTDINRTLRAVPGVNLQEEDGFGLRPNIGLRGSGSERSAKITVMEDGVLAAPAPYAAPAAYYFPTIGRMQAVEILKGSSQIRFGPYTTGGAINLISTPIPLNFSGRLNLLGGSFGNRNIHAYAGDSHRNFGYLVETFQYKSDGFKDLDGGGETGFDKKDFLAKFNLNTGPKATIYQSLQFKVAQTTERSDETYLGLTQEDFEKTPYRRYAASQKDRMVTQHEQYSVRHLVQFSPSVDLITTAYSQKFHRNWYKLDKVSQSNGAAAGIAALLADPSAFPEAFATLTGTASPIDQALAVKANNRDYRSLGVQSALSWRYQTGAIRHTLDLGIRYHFDEADRFQWTDDYKMLDGVMMLTRHGDPGTESNRVETGKAIASFAQLKMQWGKLTFIPGLRHENIRMEQKDYGKADTERLGTEVKISENKVNVFIPGAGLDFKVNSNLNFFAGVHKGFSPPGVREGSKPESSINYELGSRYQKGVLSGSVVLFFNDYENLLGADLAAAGGTGSADLFNGGKVETKGVEFQLTWDFLATKNQDWSLPVSVVYSYTDATFQSSFKSEFEGWGEVEAGDKLAYLAPNQLALVLGLNFDKIGFNLSGRYQDAMRTVASQGEVPTSESTDAYFILDANMSYRLHPKVTLFGSVANLTDEVAVISRSPAGLRPNLPRTFTAGLKVNF